MDKVICVGKNYLEHAKELGDAVPEMPVLFLKPPSAVLQIGDGTQEMLVPLPHDRGQVHPECEIVLRLSMLRGKPEIDAVTLGLDMTLRDVQSQLKKNGHPWEIAKTFRAAAVVGPWIPAQSFPDYLAQEFQFKVDGVLKQKAQGRQMRTSVTECIEHAARHFPICDGDLLFTGTPAGVSAVHPGQSAQLLWGDLLSLRIRFN